MIDGFIVIILAMLGCIGLGVLIGWSIWGNDVKYYKALYEHYKTKYNSPENKEANFQKLVKGALDKYMEDRYGERFHKLDNKSKRQ